MTRPEQDQVTVAATEVMDCADNGAFYLGQFVEYVQRGDSTGARRSLLMAEGALIRTRCAWLVLDQLTAPAKGIAA